MVFLIMPTLALSRRIFFNGLLMSFTLILTSGLSSFFISSGSYLDLFLSNSLATFFLYPAYDPRFMVIWETGCFQQLTFCYNALSDNYLIRRIVFILLRLSLAMENFSLYGQMGTIPIRTQESSLLSFDYLSKQFLKFKIVYFSDIDFKMIVSRSGMSFIRYPLVQVIFPFIETSNVSCQSSSGSRDYSVMGKLILGWGKGAKMALLPIRWLINLPQQSSCSLLLHDQQDFWNSLRTLRQFNPSPQQGRQLKILFYSVILMPTFPYRILSMYSSMQIANWESSFPLVYRFLSSTICLKLSFI